MGDLAAEKRNLKAWKRANRRIEEVLGFLKPTEKSEQNRLFVIEYLRKLLAPLNCQVFPFGSVPLKTYLPDGDIDLTALTNQNASNTFAADVFNVLEAEEHNKCAEVEVKDVQFINAEVKLVKCLVQNIIVDISFNQRGGLSALYFLELVNHLIGKEHLYKRSIMLIKAWCFYESRILGAHHGLISTYALEILVLYIFNVFYKTLNSPLMVLKKFLDYYSKFDWNMYCITLHGPILLASLPELEVEAPEPDYGELLFSKEYIQSCLDTLCLGLRSSKSSTSEFPKKHLNILDPLKSNNNLGRSVRKGNLYRIRGAFSYGAKKLSEVFTQPPKLIEEELSMFFINTVDRHEHGVRPDVQDTFPLGSVNSTYNDNGIVSMPSQSTLLVLNKEKNWVTEQNLALSPTISPQALVTHDFSSSLHNKVSSCKSTEASQKYAGTEVSLHGHCANSHLQVCSLAGAAEQTTCSSSVSEALNKVHSLSNGEKGFSVGTGGVSMKGNADSHLSDLTGDLEQYLQNFHTACYGFYGKLPQGFTVSSTHPMQCHNLQEVNGSTCGAISGLSTSSMIHSYSALQSPPLTGLHNAGKKSHSHGIGTYIPLVNHCSYRQRVPFQEKINSLPTYPAPRTNSDENVIEVVEVNFPKGNGYRNCHGNDQLKPTANVAASYSTKGNSQFNSFKQKHEGRHEIASLAPLPLAAYIPELCKKLNITDPDDSKGFDCSVSFNQHSGNRQTPERSSKSYQLKDDDFPPLCS